MFFVIVTLPKKQSPHAVKRDGFVRIARFT